MLPQYIHMPKILMQKLLPTDCSRQRTSAQSQNNFGDVHIVSDDDDDDGIYLKISGVWMMMMMVMLMIVCPRKSL